MCDCCRRLKQALWTARAQSETQTGLRNWFGTLTLSPAEHWLIITRARRRLSAGGTDYDSLSAEEQFSERMTEIGREVTLWLKRVRKESGATLRYLLVAEAHKSGAPHLHILVHERGEGTPVRYRTLASQWRLGFVKFNLVEGAKAARYVCKYISKSAMARVRASLRYGQDCVSSQMNEEKWKENKAPEKGREKRVLNEESFAFSQPSLTDRNGGKINHDVVNEPDWKQSVFPRPTGRSERNQSGSDGKPNSANAEADTVQASIRERLGPGPYEAAVQASGRKESPIPSAENPLSGDATSAKARVANRVPYSKGDDPDIPF